MAVYNSFVYGSGQVYGTDDAIEYLIWNFEVFWDDAFVDESSRMMGLNIVRGRDHLLATSGGWERFKPGEASALFDNSDGRYDPFNTSSPLYGFLLPGRVVRVSVDVTPPFSSPAQTFQVMRGIITDIQSFLRNGKRTARIIVKDGLEWLTRRSFTLGLTTDGEAMDIAGSIASGVNFGSVDDWTVSVLGNDSVVVPYAWGRENNALSVIQEFCDAEIGQVVHLADGTLALICGDYTQAATTTIDEDYLLRDMEIRQPWEVVRTRAEVTANPMAAGSSEVLWSYGVEGSIASWTAVAWNNTPTSPHLLSPLRFNGAGTVVTTVDATFSIDGPATSPVVDYEAVLWSQATFTPPFDNWVDISADVSFDLVTEDIGTGLRLTWTWDDGSVEDYVQTAVIFVDITAAPIEATDPVIAQASDAAAIVTYGEKTFVLNCPWVQTQSYAQAYADYIVDELGTAHIFPTIQLEGRGVLQFGQELFTHKIALTIPTLGIDDTFRVAKISHQWLSENGFSVRTILKLEPVLTVWNGE